MPLKIKESSQDKDYRQLGIDAFNEKRWLEAVDHMEKALKGEDSDIDLMNTLALAYDALGDGKAARAVLRKATETVPESAVAFKNLGLILSRDGRVLDAADCLCRALELDHNDYSVEDAIESVRSKIKVLKPAPAKKKAKHPGTPTHEEINSRLAKINSVLRKAARERDADPAHKTKLSLCMIVKNEEAYLTECLKRAVDVVDEMIVVDTGSSDKTVQIALSMGALVYSYNWNDNFADARNEMLKHATGDWVMVLDADERLDVESKRAVRRAIEQPTADAYEMVILNYRNDKDDSDFVVHRNCRLFRNCAKYRYSGKVHERIVPAIEAAGGKIAQMDAIVHHHGYRPEVMEEKRKDDKYIKLLKSELAENPNDLYVLHHLGAAHFTKGDHKAALKCMQKVADLLPAGHSALPAAYSRLINVLCALDRAEEALEVADKAQRAGVKHPELNYNKGAALLRLRRYQEAITEFDMAISLGKNGVWEGDASTFGHKALFGIAAANASLGKTGRADEICHSILRHRPYDVDVLNLLASIRRSKGSLGEAEDYLLKILRLHPTDTKTLMELGDVYYAMNRYKAAMGRYEEILEFGVEDAELHLRIAACNAGIEDWQSAIEHCERAIELDPSRPDSYSDLGAAYASLGNFDEAIECFSKSVEADYTYANGYFNAADILYSAGKYREAADIYQSGLSNDPTNASAFLALGNCYCQTGAYGAAVMAYRQALNLQPGYPEAVNNLSLAEDQLAQERASKAA